MSKEKFAALAKAFAKVQQAERQNAYEQGLKQRRAGAGQKGKLPSSEAKLFFVLYYFKNYPTFDVLGTHFDELGPTGRALPVLYGSFESLRERA